MGDVGKGEQGAEWWFGGRKEMVSSNPISLSSAASLLPLPPSQRPSSIINSPRIRTDYRCEYDGLYEPDVWRGEERLVEEAQRRESCSPPSLLLLSLLLPFSPSSTCTSIPLQPTQEVLRIMAFSPSTFFPTAVASATRKAHDLPLKWHHQFAHSPFRTHRKHPFDRISMKPPPVSLFY